MDLCSYEWNIFAYAIWCVVCGDLSSNTVVCIVRQLVFFTRIYIIIWARYFFFSFEDRIILLFTAIVVIVLHQYESGLAVIVDTELVEYIVQCTAAWCFDHLYNYSLLLLLIQIWSLLSPANDAARLMWHTCWNSPYLQTLQTCSRNHGLIIFFFFKSTNEEKIGFIVFV